MIQSEFRKNMALEYCRINGIDPETGRISSGQVEEMREFINSQMKIMAKRTREFERFSKLRIDKDELLKSMNFVSNFESPLEEFLHRGLFSSGLHKHFKTQFKIGKYRVDFACPEAMLVVECDGHEYHFTEKHLIERDQDRDKYLARKGWRVIHLEGIAIRRNIQFCVEKVKEALGKERLTA